ncbi:hypothetical protein [Paenibacillus sp. R14(2021)]|uniref:hypothetical protein n=1 Tax=Paenibacillus sp. R14(2021) TaxID=2859228 RepID=UPI001C615200|nr:hypothetical protein [Paenibacillus sp. R14(2021)]
MKVMLYLLVGAFVVFFFGSMLYSGDKKVDEFVRFGMYVVGAGTAWFAFQKLVYIKLRQRIWKRTSGLLLMNLVDCGLITILLAVVLVMRKEGDRPDFYFGLVFYGGICLFAMYRAITENRYQREREARKQLHMDEPKR